MLGDPGLFRGSVASFPPDSPGGTLPHSRRPVLVGRLLPGNLWGRNDPQTLNKEKGTPNILLVSASPVFPSFANVL